MVPDRGQKVRWQLEARGKSGCRGGLRLFETPPRGDLLKKDFGMHEFLIKRGPGVAESGVRAGGWSGCQLWWRKTNGWVGLSIPPRGPELAFASRVIAGKEGCACRQPDRLAAAELARGEGAGSATIEIEQQAAGIHVRTGRRRGLGVEEGKVVKHLGTPFQESARTGS